MPPHPDLIDETRAWLDRAAGDARAAEALLAVQPPLLSESAFHCQQAAEKALKAFLTWNQRAFRKTHNLEEISRACVSIDPSLAEVAEQAAALTAYAWRFRYPGAPYEPGSEDVFTALAAARAVVTAVATRLPPAVRPNPR